MSSWAEKVAREGYAEYRREKKALCYLPWRHLDSDARQTLIAIARHAIERGREPEPESGSPQDGRSPGMGGSPGGSERA